eukprot:CAMPEP_0194710228 /NCGR_PEP_ID=MMETSP0296-20130528/2849_1 /TAXON_ID=39354 /ORGANISM="Heterosigma akashiwo, Strain CCMP2393" /LENGTH=391 /DNA_ID=CAMNT_0039607829 /DNA_START=22 /DNA_END=1194 /DNA_ORIENTATION=+
MNTNLYPIPENEEARIETLQSYEVLDTPAELAFDRITALAARMFEVEIALVSLVDTNRQWFKSKHGLGACETSRSTAFCAHAIADGAPDVFVVLDATKDQRFSDNPLVTGDPFIRFYAGAPLSVDDGVRLGTLCIISTTPRTEFSIRLKMDLTDLASMVVEELTLRKLLIQNHKKQLSSASHDLKTPLFCFSLCLDALDATKLASSQRRILDHARGNVDLMKWTVDNALQVHQQQQNQQQEPQHQQADQEETIAVLEVVTRVQKVVKYYPKRVRILCILDDDVPKDISTVPVRLVNALINYLTNSCKFTASGEIKLRISAVDDLALGGAAVVFEVEDTGCGVQDPSVLFKETSRDGEFIGSGLAAVHHHMRVLGGRCGHHARADGKRGACF